MHRVRLPLLGLAGLLVLLLGLPAATPAAPIAHQGLIFSDELGGFDLVAVSGSGTLDDPITVVERVTGNRAITLTIRNFGRDFGNRIGSQHVAAFAMKKVVINDTGHVWRNYQMELREVTTRHSPYGDGLSFGQNSYIGLHYTKSSFPKIQRFDEPEDTLGFSGIEVAPGEEAEFSFIVSDMSPVSVFYLLQLPLQPLSQNGPVTERPREWASTVP
ncbi:hypothetical protein [Dongia rigui]|uniref:Uncharacterized protein n=1 Tax=Dongia rigui TaxID=940149 RepID=A0ABU5E3S6_9PROT|nr:hypothetical protein [Dongia rigui]MDY0874183.1 hypothetical protein [Dongia rigui]